MVVIYNNFNILQILKTFLPLFINFKSLEITVPFTSCSVENLSYSPSIDNLKKEFYTYLDEFFHDFAFRLPDEKNN